jgi:hypothetical protein
MKASYAESNLGNYRIFHSAVVNFPFSSFMSLRIVMHQAEFCSSGINLTGDQWEVSDLRPAAG